MAHLVPRLPSLSYIIFDDHQVSTSLRILAFALYNIFSSTIPPLFFSLHSKKLVLLYGEASASSLIMLLFLSPFHLSKLAVVALTPYPYIENRYLNTQFPMHPIHFPFSRMHPSSSSIIVRPVSTYIYTSR